MLIKAGEITIDTGAEGIYGEKVYSDGAMRPTLRINLPGGISQAEIEALLVHPWEIYDNAEPEKLLSTHKGFDKLYQHQITFVCMDSQEAIANELKQQLDLEKSRREALEAKLTEATLRAITLEAEKQDAVTALETVTQELATVKSFVLTDETSNADDTKKGESL